MLELRAVAERQQKRRLHVGIRRPQRTNNDLNTKIMQLKKQQPNGQPAPLLII